MKYFVIKTILIKIIYLKHYTNLSKVYDKNEKQQLLKYNIFDLKLMI